MFPLRDTIPSRRRPIVTWSLIAINILVFVLELRLGREALESLFYVYGIVPARFTHPDWARSVGLPAANYWPFLTSMFLHGGWLHVIGNMWTLWIFGDNVEDRMGPVRYLIFYLLMGVVSGATLCLTGSGSTVPTVGASGAIAGVLGAYFLLFPRARILTVFPILFWPFFFEVPAVLYLLLWFVTQIFGGSVLGANRGGGIAWWAHVGGFAAGAILHRLFLAPGRRPPPPIEADQYGMEGAWDR